MPSAKKTARFVFSASVLALVLYLFDANDVFATILSVGGTTVVIAVGYVLSAQLFAAIRLDWLLRLQDIVLSRWRVFLIGLSAVFYGLVVPGGTLAAFAVRFAQLSRGVPLESVAAALIVDRMAATVFLVAVGAITFGIDQMNLLWVGAIAVGTGICVGIFVFGQKQFIRLIELLDTALSRDSSGKFHGFAERIGTAFRKYSETGSRQNLMVLALSLLAHLAGCLMYFTIATSMDLNISFLSICWIRSGIILWTMIPISVAGLGLREVAAIVLLVPLGVTETQAVSFSLLVFLVTPVIVGLIGGVGELLRVK